MVGISLRLQKAVPNLESYICLKTRAITSKFLKGKLGVFSQTPAPGMMPNEHGFPCCQQSKKEKCFYKIVRLLKHLDLVDDFQHGLFLKSSAPQYMDISWF